MGNGHFSRQISLWGVVCHPWASTCYVQAIYQVWSLAGNRTRPFERQQCQWP